jgi:hypothetical protein
LENQKQIAQESDSAVKLQKLAEQMRFRMKEATAQRGGSATFLHWLQANANKKG